MVGVGDGYQGNGCSPSSLGNQWLCHPASYSGEDGSKFGSEIGTVVGGWSVATEKEEWTEACPRVCLPFLFYLFLS